VAWTLDFFDTFTHYEVTTAKVTSYGKWTSLNGTSAPATIAEDGLQGIAPQDLRANMSTSTFGRMVGCRVFPNAFVNGASGVLAILGGGALQFSINRNETSGAITIHLPDASSITSATTLSAGTGYNLELGGFLDGVNMYYEVKVDGVQVADITDLVGTAYVTTVALDTISPSRGGGSGVCLSDYAWMWSKTYSGSGGIWAAGDWIGNGKRGVLYPSAEGLFQKTSAGAFWTPNTGSTYYEALDETLVDEDTTYLTTTNDPNDTPLNTDRASVKLQDSAADVDTILIVQRSTTLRAPVGTNDAKLFTRVDTDSTPSNTTLDAEFTVPSSWTTKRTIYGTDPRDSGAWSKAKLDNLEIGIETQDLV